MEMDSIKKGMKVEIIFQGRMTPWLLNSFQDPSDFN
jgi:hypothetical protein